MKSLCLLNWTKGQYSVQEAPGLAVTAGGSWERGTSGGAEARVRLGAAAVAPGGGAGGGATGDGVSGAGAALPGLLRDHLLQGVLLLHFENALLLSVILADPGSTGGSGLEGFC